MVLLWVLIAVAVVIAFTFFMYYNRFVRLSHQIDNSLAQIDVQLKKRADLVPNLLSSVKFQRLYLVLVALEFFAYLY